MRTQQPPHAMSGSQRPWRAVCLPAVRVTHAICGARLARARRGPSGLAALAWRWRHRQRPWAPRLGARVRGILRPQGRTSGRRVVDAPAHPRSPSAQALASWEKRRDTARGGALWGPRRVLLVLVPPPISRPVGVAGSPPAPECSAWQKKAKALTKPGGPASPRPRQAAPHPQSPPKAPRARRGLASCKAQQPAGRRPAGMAAALSGTAPCVAGAAALFRGVQGLAPSRSQPHRRGGPRPQPGAASWAPPPGTPSALRRRGGVAGGARGGRARLSVYAHTTHRFIVASQ
jgi:hypothetical protein